MQFGTLAVRKGDDPYVLAQNFVHTFSLRKSMVEEIVVKIKEQLLAFYLRQTKERAQHSRQSRRTASSSSRGVGAAPSDSDGEEFLSEGQLSEEAEEYDRGEEKKVVSKRRSKERHSPRHREKRKGGSRPRSSRLRRQGNSGGEGESTGRGNRHLSTGFVMCVCFLAVFARCVVCAPAQQGCCYLQRMSACGDCGMWVQTSHHVLPGRGPGRGAKCQDGCTRG